MRHRISKRADRDLDAIWDHVAADDPGAADRVEADLHAAVGLIARTARDRPPATGRG